MTELTPETAERLRALPPEQAYEEIRRIAFRTSEGGGSDAYLDLMEALVREGILTWDQVEELEQAQGR